MTPIKCKRCEKSGLSILPVRPTAIALESVFAPPGAERLLTHKASISALNLPTLKKSRYALRLLRQDGYVHVYYPGAKPEGQKSDWQVFKVFGQGALMPEGEYAEGTPTDFACIRKSTHPHDVRTVCIQEPAKVKTVWIGFSMSKWSDTVRSQVLQDKKAAGMVEVDLTRASQPSGFKADAKLIGQHVADYALGALTHAGVDSATPFYPAKQGEAVAVSLAMVMRQQASVSPDTLGKEQVLVLPDPVGLAADLNGIRIARDKALKESFANSAHARALASDATLRALEEAVRAEATLRAEDDAYGSISQAKWNTVKDQPAFKGYQWQPSPRGGMAADGSLQGRAVNTGDKARHKTVTQRSTRLGDADWDKIGGQLEAGRRKDGVEQAHARLKKDLETLTAFEDEWQTAMKAPATLSYFQKHCELPAVFRLPRVDG